MKKISLEKLNALFAEIAETKALYLPVDTETGAQYQKWEEGKTLSSALNTVRSAKDFFFPQTESLVHFKVEGKKIEIMDVRDEGAPFVIFGVRGCDVKSFELLDRVFLQDPVDTYYQNRRNNAIIVSLACSEPEETCFCHSFGISAADPAGDVTAWIKDGEIIFRANTEKGEQLLAPLPLEEGGEAKAEEARSEIEAITKKLPLQNLPLEKFKAENLMDFFNDPKWASLSQSCLGCGTCTFVCPTCHCFDIRDFDTGHGVQRFRCWDSCMYRDFSQMAAANPRLSQLERFRQRFMHKLVYYPANHEGRFLCVGCGRCLSRCPISMDIVKVIKELGGERDAK